MLLSERITEVFTSPEGKVTVEEILIKAQRQGFGFLMVVLTVPVALPITPPGLSVPFGILVFGLAVQLILRRETPWFPKWIMKKELKAGEDSKLLKLMRKFVKLFERFLKPRRKSLYSGASLRSFLGPVIALCSLGMMIPGFLSWLPAVGAFLVGLGMMEEDGNFGLIGAVVGILGLVAAIAITIAIIYFGVNIDEFLPQL